MTDVNKAKTILDGHYYYVGGKGYSTGWNIARDFLKGDDIWIIVDRYEHLTADWVQDIIRSKLVMAREELA